MPAVVRVKRRIDEEPLSAFVLNGKRRRVEEDSDDTASALAGKDELSTLLKFAGTIEEQDDTATTQFARLTKEEAKELVLQKSKKPKNVTDKARQELRQHQQEQRFRVVNCLRTTLEEDNNSNEKSKEITIVDIEKHSTNDNKTEDNSKSPLALSTSNNMLTNLGEPSTSTAAAAATAAAALTMPTDSDTGYVYDLYIPDNEQQANYVDLMDDNYLSIRAFDDLVYEDCYNNDEDDEYDSEDSNQENHFGNEYPDEDDDAALHSDREYDDMDDEDEDAKSLRKGLEKFVFDDDDEENDIEGYDDSSSDDNGSCNNYRDPYVHSVDPEEQGFCNDVDSCDVDRYGLAYARYKARILKKSQAKIEDSDIDDDEKDLERDFYKSGTDEDDDEYYNSANQSDD